MNEGPSRRPEPRPGPGDAPGPRPVVTQTGAPTGVPGSGEARPPWREMLAALRVPAFAWYWGGQLLSNVGTWSQTLAQAWLVLRLTHSAVALGTVTMLQFLPVLAFALVGGVVADHLPRRQLLVGTQVALALQAAALGALVATHVVTIFEVGALALLLGTTNSLNNPAQQAFVPELVGRDLLADAIALNSAQFNTARLVGGALGGLAIATWGVSGALFLNAASFLPLVGVLLAVRPAHSAAHTTTTRRSAVLELRGGLAYAWSTVPVRRVVAIFGVVGLLGFNWQVAVPLIAHFVLHRSATGFGDLMAALGAGSLLAAVALARYRHASEHRLIAGGLGLGAVLVGLGLSHWYWASMALLTAGGIAGITASITANTRLQLLTPEHLRGRVMAIYVLLTSGTTPLGAFVLGEMSGHLGTGAALVTFGAATILGVASLGLVRPGLSRGQVQPRQIERLVAPPKEAQIVREPECTSCQR